MKLLLDANLSWRLIKRLEGIFAQIYHVDQVVFPPPAADTAIWEWADKNNAIIVTNDADFRDLMVQRNFPPKVILLRVGNLTTNKAAEILTENRANIEVWNEQNQYGILEII